MYGIYKWQAGATGPQVVADLVAMICGAAVADLSAVCDKAASSVAGAASGWSVIDAAYGVIAAPSQFGGPAMQARVMASDVPRLLLAAVHGWDAVAHLPGAATNAHECSGTVADAGAVNVMATPAGLLVAASDWSMWALFAEVKRGGPAIAAGMPGTLVFNGYGYGYAPEVKNPEALGVVENAAVAVVSAYSGLSALAARDASDMLYTPMVPACASVKQVPFGEIGNVLAVGGYGQSGDMVTDAGGGVWQIVRVNSGLGLALGRV